MSTVIAATVEYLPGRTKKTEKRAAFERCPLEHVLSYQRRIALTSGIEPRLGQHAQAIASELALCEPSARLSSAAPFTHTSLSPKYMKALAPSAALEPNSFDLVSVWLMRARNIRIGSIYLQ